MGAADFIARRAWAVIIAWLVVAGLAAPLAARLNKVMVTKEESFLPPSAESVRAEKALGGSKTEPDAVIVVTGANVSLEAYWRLRKPWAHIDWGNSTHLSWIDVLDKVYSMAYNASLQGVNSSVAALRGYVTLWNATLQAEEGLERLAMLLNATAKSVAAVDKAYKGYMGAARSLEAAKPGLEDLLSFAASVCRAVPRAYADILFDVARAEYLIENKTEAYERGYMTPADVEAVVEASNLSSLGIPPLPASLVVAVFNLTMEAGGPRAFNNTLAAWEAYVVMNSTLPSQVSLYVEKLYLATANALSKPGVPELRSLAASIEGLRTLSRLALNATAQSAPLAMEAYGWGLANRTGKPIIGWTLEAFARMGCNESLKAQALEAGMYRQLVANGMNPYPAAAVARGVAWGNLSRLYIALIASRVVAAAAESSGAPPILVEALNSTATASVVVEYDPNATGALLANHTLARLAAARILEAHSRELHVSPGVIEALASGAQPSRLAVELVESQAPPEARPLLEAFSRKGIPRDLDSLLAMAEPVIVEQASRMGNINESQARLIVEEAVKVFKGEEELDDAAASLARRAVEAGWDRVMDEIEGSLVSTDHKAFLVLLFNVSYDDAKRIEGETQKALGEAGFEHARVLATGGVVTDKEIMEAALRDVERSDRVSMILVFIILALVLESIVAVFLPFTGIGLGLALALGVAYTLASRGVITVSSISRSVMFSTGLGLGIDYAAYISRRFREEMGRASDKRAAAAAALRASVRPVTAGAATAAIGFGSLALAWDFPFLKSIGTSVPLAIAFVAAASLTFIPALLALVGSSRILWWPLGPSRRREGAPGRLGGLVSRRPIAALLVGLVLVALVPAVHVHMSFKGTHDITLMLPEGTESLEGMKVINSRFDPGVLYPLYVVPSKPSLAQNISQALQGLSCIARAEVRNTSSGRAYVIAIPSVNPLESPGVECARQVRGLAHRIDPGSLVGGMSAVSLDLEDLLNARFYHRVLPAAVGLMFLSMLAAYGGVATALAAVGVVSIAAEYSIGATVYYYQHIKGMGVPWFLPIVVFTAIMGVGMDYNSFSISRAAEECLRECRPTAVGKAVSRAAVLVLGLATIMAGAYGGLTLSSTPHLRMMGTSLLMGVLFAGVLASVALTPPLIALLGRAAWWPWGPRAEAPEVQ